MRALIIRNAFAYDFGGGERFPVNLAAELQKAGWQSLVVSRSVSLLRYAHSQGVGSRRGWWWSRQSWSGWRVILVPVYLLWQLVLTIWYLQLIGRFWPAVVHVQSRDDFIAASLAARLLGRRVVWTDHADLKYVFANHRVWYKNPVGKLVYACSHLAHAISLVSQSEKQLIEEQLGHALPPRFSVIYNGVNEVAPKAHERSEAERSQYIYCCTSRLVAAKGIGELVQAFSQLHAKHPDTALWLVGDGPEAERFKQQAKDVPAIKFVGHSDNALSYVAASDVFVHPSYHEGFSLSLVEAAMLGKPIIACAVGGNPEIIKAGQSGLLVPARDSQALASAMTKLYSERQLAQKLGQVAHQIYLDRFQFNKIVKEQFLPLYEK